MFLADVIVILLLAFLIAAVFAFPLGRPGPWGGFLWLFLVVFLGTWAVAAWAQPVGPVVAGVAWVPILVAALLIGLLVAAIPPSPVRPRTAKEELAEAEAVAAVGGFFWLLLLGLIVVVGLSYVLA